MQAGATLHTCDRFHSLKSGFCVNPASRAAAKKASCSLQASRQQHKQCADTPCLDTPAGVSPSQHRVPHCMHALLSTGRSCRAGHMQASCVLASGPLVCAFGSGVSLDAHVPPQGGSLAARPLTRCGSGVTQPSWSQMCRDTWTLLKKEPASGELCQGLLMLTPQLLPKPAADAALHACHTGHNCQPLASRQHLQPPTHTHTHTPILPAAC